MDNEQFNWIPFYMEFADKLKGYQNNRNELVKKIIQVFDGIEMNLPKLEKDGEVFDIDPFTVYGLFNKGITNVNRISIIKGFADVFSMTSEIPTNFDGIPVLNNQKATFYWFIGGRQEDDIDNLWKVFQYACDYADNQNSQESKKLFVDYYDRCLKQKGVKWNITMGLFWARPYKYINLDSRNREFLSDTENMPAAFVDSLKGLKEVPDGSTYIQICEDALNSIQSGSYVYKTLPDLSYYAWTSTKSNDEAKSKISNAAFMRWMRPLIEALKKLGGSGSPKEARDQIIIDEGLSAEEVAVTTGKTNVNKFENQVAFARSYLVSTGYISNAEHGVWKLTDKGYNVEMTDELASQIIKDVVSNLKTKPQDDSDSSIDSDVETVHYWLYAPGEGSCKWDEFYNAGIMAIGWGELGDLNTFMKRSEMVAKMQEVYEAPDKSFKNDSLATWQFSREVKPGDVIFVKKGLYQIVGRGIVESDYFFDDEREDTFNNVRNVIWTNKGLWDHPGKAAQKTLTDITQYTDYVQKLEGLFEDELNPVVEEPVIKLTPYTEQDFLDEVFMDEKTYRRLTGLLTMQKNLILQGAPGVGKTYAAKRLAYAMMGVKDPKRVMMIQFHQSYSYEDFIMGFRPTEAGGFELKPGAFYTFCKKAEEDSENSYFFIIDEINRGNLSKIFGELFMLIEKDKRGNKNQLRLLYKDEQFFVPENVFIIGMMNTADRSLAMLDYALRRRFVFFEMTPAFETESFKQYEMTKDNIKFDQLINVIKQLNDDITHDDSLGSGFQIGHSYFCLNKEQDVTDEWLDGVVEYQIIPLIREYWFDEPDKVDTWSDTLRRAIQ